MSETLDVFLGGRLSLAQPARGFRAGMDAVLLAAAVPAHPGQSALELGAGAGAAILSLGARVPGLALAALEIQSAYVDLLRRNAQENGIAVEAIEGDVSAAPAALRGRAFDHVLLNPPYFDRRSSSRAADPGRDVAHAGSAPLGAWLGLAGRRLRTGGTLTLILRAARLRDLLAACPPTLGSLELLPLASREGDAPATVLLRARKGGRAPFRLHDALAVHAGPAGMDGKDFAPWARAVLRDAAPLPWPCPGKLSRGPSAGPIAS